jgi:hypothetical protein
LGAVPHKTGHAAISTFIAYIKVCVETFSLRLLAASSLIVSTSYVERNAINTSRIDNSNKMSNVFAFLFVNLTFLHT